MIAIDANMLRDPDIQLHGLHKADDVYTFYYDETNNVRRLHIREDGLNVPDMGCFALGGIAYRGEKRSLDIDGLRTKLGLQKTLKEIKFKNLAQGTFPEATKSKKLTIFLEWLWDQELLVHFFVLDPIYWAVVDIIDAILMESDQPQLYSIHLNLKNDIYAILRHDRDATIDLFRRHSFPNVGGNGMQSFVADLRIILEGRQALLPAFNFQMLKGVLQIAQKLDTLPLLEDEIANVLVERFGEFYGKRVCLFKNSNHIFDAEDEVRRYFSKFTFVDAGRPLQNYQFVISEDEPGVQISDVMIGLIGRFYSFVNCTNAHELGAWFVDASPVQRNNLDIFSRILDRSIEENQAFAHYVLSADDLQRGAILWK